MTTEQPPTNVKQLHGDKQDIGKILTDLVLEVAMTDNMTQMRMEIAGVRASDKAMIRATVRVIVVPEQI